MKKNFLFVLPLVFITSCGITGSNSTPVKFELCFKIVDKWECKINARFKEMDDCLRYKMISGSLINYNTLQTGQPSTIVLAPQSLDIQSTCKE